jgi:DNA repair photolyase
LTRAGGYLKTVCSHSLQPYRGCGFGRALCGAYCYVQHNVWVTKGREWGSFVEAKANAAELYAAEYETERRWGRAARGAFSVFLSSSTDPFVPQEDLQRVTQRVLERMLELPPDELIVQTHTDRVLIYRELYPDLGSRTRLRFHISVESDRDRMPGLPPPAASVDARLAAAAALRIDGHRVVITISPLLPIAEPRRFLARIAECADAVVLDHFIGGDGTPNGSRTLRTALPAAIARLDPEALELGYRDRIVALAREVMPGRVGVAYEGFAGRLSPPH